jgi:outer membrane protein assembly factor BamB
VFVTVGPTIGTPQGTGNNPYAFNVATGAVDWFTPLSSTSGELGLTYDGGQVFVQNSDGNLTAYNAASGHANWTTAPGQYLFSAPPTACDGVPYAPVPAAAARSSP